MPQTACTEQTTVILANESRPVPVLIELLTNAVAGQLHGTGKELIRVHPIGGTALPGEEHLMKWKVRYDYWPAPDTSEPDEK
ncbi:hypothetical protein [Mycolicibacterium sp. lyk4-40-TYG-92]|uniref:hypothetical protein n=1 Tax=Mycolicibacterium sp. lyk4-40-TYG-92 TaxID=3040295 RepID=UPI002550C270|nr:hypothetical protein [Mycolicibacterium sp. lyk4-40-TYG-92]